MEQEDAPLVIDNGSAMIKAGFGGEDHPHAVFPSIVGRIRSEYISKIGYGSFMDAYVGYEAINISKRNMLINKYPIKDGIIINWDDIEWLLHHTFYNELRVAPEEHPILLTEKPLNPKANREKLTQIMFETFNVPKFYVAKQNALSLYSTGRINGIVLDSGFNITHCTPIYQGYCLPHAALTTNVAGSDITQYLQQLLTKKGYSFLTMTEKDIVAKIKEEYCFIALDKDLEKATFEEEYELPDNRIIKIGEEMFESTEILFKPQLIGLQCDGIHELLYKSAMHCDQDIQEELLKNVVFCGGTTKFKGFDERLLKELQCFKIGDGDSILVDGYLRKYYSNNNKRFIYKDIIDIMNKYTCYQCNIIQTGNRNYASWKGGSMLSKLSHFEEMWVTNEQYDECGPSIVHRKCM